MSKTDFVYYLVPDHNSPEIQLKPKMIYNLGRSPKSNILLTDSAVSREHAKLTFSDTTFCIEDLRSSNGTMVNNQMINKVELENLDRLTFGRISFTFKIKKQSLKGNTTLSPDDISLLEEDLDQIIKNLKDTQIKTKLLEFQNKLKKKGQNLINLAYKDELTGLYNRRYFDKMLTTEIKRANRYGRGLTLIMVDIDHFKKFNDTYGHQKGDSVLRTVASILNENCRSSDIVCRYGGEEMAILLPEQKSYHGLETAEKLRKIMIKEAQEIEEVHVTASFGVSSTKGFNTKGEELIKKSDEALYLAKKDGRNCTKVLNMD